MNVYANLYVKLYNIIKVLKECIYTYLSNCVQKQSTKFDRKGVNKQEMFSQENSELNQTKYTKLLLYKNLFKKVPTAEG